MPDLLYGVEASYYAAKIRAYLQHKQIPFEEIQADRSVFAETVLPRVGWPVLPVIVTTDDVTLQDTAQMIDYYEARYPTPSILPRTAAGRALSYWLEMLGDEWLKMPAMHYRWNHNYDFVIAEFGRNNDPHRTTQEQRRVGRKIAPTFQRWLPAIGATPATAAAIETDYLEFLALFDRHLDKQPFLLGAGPTLGDFAFYGPLYAHLYRDPASGRVMRAHAPRVCEWVERLRDGPTPRAPVFDPDPLSGDLTALLELLARDYVPILLNAIPALQSWLADNPDVEEMPRYIGEHTFALGRGTSHLVTETRCIASFDQWKMQRVLDVNAAADGHGRDAIRALFAAIGAEALLDLRCDIRVKRENFRLLRDAA